MRAPFLLAAALLAITGASLRAQQPPAPASPYEDTVDLQASLILKPELMSTPLFRVRDLVVTDLGVNTFAIDTERYGPILANGNSELIERMAEVAVMKRIDDMKRTEAYKEAMEEAAERESEAADDAVVDYVSPIDKLPKTPEGKFFYRIGRETEKDIDADDVREYKAFQRQSTLAVAKAKLELCRYLSVNPYTTNRMLQRKLDDVSRAMGVGGLRLAPGLIDPDDSLASTLYRSQIPPQVSALIYANDREQLRALNQAALQKMGISAPDATAFLSNAAFTPWQQTQFITALQALPGVAGRDLLLRDAARSSAEDTDATFYAETARLLALFAAQGWQIARIELNSILPYCILRDGSVLLAIHWDYARWSPTAASFAKWLQSLKLDGKKPAAVTLAISGLASPQCRREMEQRGFKALDRLIRGPLN